MNIQFIEGGICAPRGFKAAGMASGIKKRGGLDMAMVLSERKCSAAAVYTQNKVKAAPLLLTRQALADGTAQGILCNSGNANACNPDGMRTAAECARLAAEATGLGAGDFVVASTGVIGQALPLEPFREMVPKLAAALSADGAADAARASKKSDTQPKV
jgi:glutamate N-acetyltransferase/amino-acid N-acetyltransferase